jgi:predicted restriction endonuclease
LVERSQEHGVYHISPKGRAVLLEKLAASMQPALADIAERLSGEGIFDPNGITDAREKILVSIVRRRGQPAFRRTLLAAYEGRCAISGCDVEAVLDAAHIVPYQGPQTNHPANGLLMRTDLHALFDLGLLAIDPTTMTVLLSRSLDGTCYEEYRGKPVRLPDELPSRPSRDALEGHREASGLR